MYKNKNHAATLQTSMTIAAMSILLAACGGGSDGDSSAVSASPDASTSSSAALNTSTATSPVSGTDANSTAAAPNNTGTDTTNGTNAGAANTGANTTTGSNTAGNSTSDSDGTASGSLTDASATATAAISDQGVRGDVVLALMEQNGCIPHYINRTETLLGATIQMEQAETPFVAHNASLWRADKVYFTPYTYDYSAWNHGGNAPTLMPDYISNCTHASTRSYSNPTPPGHYNFEIYSSQSWVFRSYFPTHFTRGFNRANASFAVNVTADQIEIGSTVRLELAEDLLYIAIRTSSAPSGRTFSSELSGEAHSIRRDALVPFDTAFQWQDDAGNSVRLKLVKGDTADQARLCTEFNTSLAKRQHCKTWHVPDGWQWGQELTKPNVYIIDDRSVYPNESGYLYWGTVGHFYEQRQG